MAKGPLATLLEPELGGSILGAKVDVGAVAGGRWPAGTVEEPAGVVAGGRWSAGSSEEPAGVVPGRRQPGEVFDWPTGAIAGGLSAGRFDELAEVVGGRRFD